MSVAHETSTLRNMEVSLYIILCFNDPLEQVSISAGLHRHKTRNLPLGGELRN